MKRMIFLLLLCVGCFAQISQLQEEVEQSRQLAALSLLEAQNKGTTGGYSPAISVQINYSDDTIYVPLYNLTIQRCQPGKSGTYCESGTATTFQYCSANDNSCNGGTDTGALDGGGTSQIWNYCNNLTHGGKSDWRVWTNDEAANLNLAASMNVAALGYSGWSGWQLHSGTATQGYIRSSGISSFASLGNKSAATASVCVHDGS